MSNSKNKTILVSGGAGYVGLHVCKALRMEGYNVVVFDFLVRTIDFLVMKNVNKINA